MFENHEPDSIPRPFVAAPDANRYFPSTAAEEARQRISRAIVRAEGPALLIGAAGTGKSLMLEVLTKQFGEQMETVPLGGGQICTRRALLQTILFQLGVSFDGLDEGELRLALQSFLQPRDEPVRRILLLVDEAESVPLRLLEELRVLSNISQHGQSLVSLVLAGNPGLEERFAEPELSRFSQRLSTRCYLSSLGREETFQYVRAQVAAVGLQPQQLFAQDGLEALFATTDGLPRLINQLGDQLIWTAYATKRTPIGNELVQQAWSESQQLPAPWDTPVSEPPSFEGAVEFGELDGETFAEPSSEEMPASIPMSHATSDEFQFEEVFEAEPEPVTIEAIEHEFVDDQEVVESEPQIAEVSIPLAARDPFAEVFSEEEVLLDRYTKLETVLLASAPAVVNRLDTAFAGDLQECVAAEIAEEAIVEDAAEPAIEETIRLETAFLDESDTELDPEEDELPASVETPVMYESVGDLLIVEDERLARAEVVTGRRFRQLFSSLESRQA